MWKGVSIKYFLVLKLMQNDIFGENANACFPELTWFVPPPSSRLRSNQLMFVKESSLCPFTVIAVSSIYWKIFFVDCQQQSCTCHFCHRNHFQLKDWTPKRVNRDTTYFATKQRNLNYMSTESEIKVKFKCFVGVDGCNALVIVVVVVFFCDGMQKKIFLT